MRLAPLFVLLPACGIRYWVWDEVDAAKLQKLPMQLSETQLFVAPGTLAPGVVA